jgi:hypothetical protein
MKNYRTQYDTRRNFAFVNSRIIYLSAVLAALFAVYCSFFDYLPFQDIPNLLYQGIIYGKIIFEGNDFGGYYILQEYIPPNTISTFIFSLFTQFISPLASAKLYIFLLGALLFSGIYRYLRYHSKLSSAAAFIIAFIFALNMHYLSGYLNFVTGIAFVLHAITMIRKRNWHTHIIPMSSAFVVAYLCHFFALFIFGLYFIVYILTTKQYKSLVRLIVAGIPAAALFGHYFMTKTLGSADSLVRLVTFVETILWKSFVFFAPVIPFHQFKWITETPQPLGWVNLFYCLSIALCTAFALFKSIRERKYSLSFWLFIVTTVVLLGLPSYLSGNMLPGERLSLFAILNALILISEFDILERVKKILLPIGIAVCILIGIQVSYNTYVFNEIVDSGIMPKDAIELAYTKREGTNGFLHFHIYKAIEDQQGIPLFTTGLITYRGANPATPDGR